MNAPRTSSTLSSTRDVYDVAQLAGGLPRVVDTAVVALLERGRLVVDGAGRLSAVGTAVHPVEAAVLELAGPRPRRSVATVRVHAQEDPRLTGVAERLVAAGLLRRNPLAALSSSWPAHLRTAAARRVLQEWTTAPPVGGGIVAVALAGPDRMADRVLREAAFLPPAASRRPGRRVEVRGADPGTSAWAVGGWGGGWGAWGGDGGGGGFGGGDGGGCGGGDGGGGGGGC